MRKMMESRQLFIPSPGGSHGTRACSSLLRGTSFVKVCTERFANESCADLPVKSFAALGACSENGAEETGPEPGCNMCTRRLGSRQRKLFYEGYLPVHLSKAQRKKKPESATRSCQAFASSYHLRSCAHIGSMHSHWCSCCSQAGLKARFGPNVCSRNLQGWIGDLVGKSGQESE